MTNIAKALISVKPDMVGFTEAVKAELDKQKTAEIKVTPVFDPADLKKQVQAAADEAKAEVKVAAVVDTKEIQEGIDKARAEAEDKPIILPVIVDQDSMGKVSKDMETAGEDAGSNFGGGFSKTAEKEAEKAGEKSGKGFGSKLTSSISNMTGLSSGMLGAAGIGAVAAGVIKAGMDIQDANDTLNQALKNNGQSFAANEKAIKANTTAMANFGISGVTAEKGLATLEPVTSSVKESIQLEGDAANVAAAKHIGFAAALKQVMMMAAGAPKGLKQMGDVAVTGATQAVAYASASALLAARVQDAGGMAKFAASQHISYATALKEVTGAEDGSAAAADTLAKHGLTVATAVKDATAAAAGNSTALKALKTDNLSVAQAQALASAATKGNIADYNKLGIEVLPKDATAAEKAAQAHALLGKYQGDAQAASMTLSGSLEALKAKFEDIGEEIGGPVVKDLTGLMGWLTKTHLIMPILISGITLLASTMVAKMAMASISTVQGAAKMVAGWVGIGAASEETTATVVAGDEEMGAAADAAAGPWGLIIAAVAAAAFFIVKYHKQIWDEIKKVWGDIESFLKDVMKEVVNLFEEWTIAGEILKHWNTIESDAKKVWGDIIKFFKGVPGDILSVFKNLGTDIVNLILGPLKNIGGDIKKTVGNLGHDVASIFHFAPGGLVPGSGTTDSVSAMLTPGEIVVPTNVVPHVAAELSKYNIPGVTASMGLAAANTAQADPNTSYSTTVAKMVQGLQDSRVTSILHQAVMSPLSGPQVPTGMASGGVVKGVTAAPVAVAATVGVDLSASAKSLTDQATDAAKTVGDTWAKSGGTWYDTAKKALTDNVATPVTAFVSKTIPAAFTSSIPSWFKSVAPTHVTQVQTPLNTFYKTTLPANISSGFTGAMASVGKTANADIGAINAVTKVGGISPIGSLAFAKGGVMPGYEPGHDTLPIMVSGGEGILVPEAVQGIGGAAAINGLNKQFGGYRGAGFANGGITGDTVASYATTVGNKYTWGGAAPPNTDCSGFTAAIYEHFGLIPAKPGSRWGTSESQFVSPLLTSAGDQPGAMVFFAGSDGTNAAPGHVGISLGNGKYVGADGPQGAANAIDSVSGNLGFRVPKQGWIPGGVLAQLVTAMATEPFGNSTVSKAGGAGSLISAGANPVGSAIVNASGYGYAGGGTVPGSLNGSALSQLKAGTQSSVGAKVAAQTAALAKLTAGGDLGLTGVSNASGLAAITSAAKAHGWTGAQLQAFLGVEAIEDTSMSLTATNASSGAYGMAQFINGASEYAQYGGNSTTYAGQATAMANYIAQRYTTPEAALAHEHSSGYYATGGSADSGIDQSANSYLSAWSNRKGGGFGAAWGPDVINQQIAAMESAFNENNSLAGASGLTAAQRSTFKNAATTDKSKLAVLNKELSQLRTYRTDLTSASGVLGSWIKAAGSKKALAGDVANWKKQQSADASKIALISKALGYSNATLATFASDAAAAATAADDSSSSAATPIVPPGVFTGSLPGAPQGDTTSGGLLSMSGLLAPGTTGSSAASSNAAGQAAQTNDAVMAVLQQIALATQQNAAKTAGGFGQALGGITRGAVAQSYANVGSGYGI